MAVKNLFPHSQLCWVPHQGHWEWGNVSVTKSPCVCEPKQWHWDSCESLQLKSQVLSWWSEHILWLGCDNTHWPLQDRSQSMQWSVKICRDCYCIWRWITFWSNCCYLKVFRLSWFPVWKVYNGLLEREDWETACQIPIGVIPQGSGNGLARSLAHFSGYITLKFPSSSMLSTVLQGTVYERPTRSQRAHRREAETKGYGFMHDARRTWLTKGVPWLAFESEHVMEILNRSVAFSQSDGDSWLTSTLKASGYA